MKGEQEIFNNNMDFKALFQRLYSYKKTYLLVIVVFLFLAFLVNRFSDVKYTNYSTLYLNNDESNNALNSPTDLIQGIGMFNGKKNIDNELEILKSFTLVKKVIDETDLKVSYYAYNNSQLAVLLFNTPFTRKRELYRDAPIEVVLDPSLPQAINLQFKIVFLNENEFMIQADGTDIPLYNYIDDQVISLAKEVHFHQRFHFGDEIKNRYFNFRVQKSKLFDKDFTENYNLFFYFNNINELTLSYQSAIKAATSSETSTVIQLSLSGTNKQRITDFLNNLTSNFLGKSLDKKNKTALSTINFIDTQISDVADSLNFVESRLKNFRTAQGVMDLNFQGQQVFEQLSKLENERAALIVQKKYYEYLDNYLTSNTELTDLPAPSSMNVMDPILTSLVSTIIQLSGERASLLRNATSQQNLYLSDINIRIANTKKTIQETVKTTLNGLNISLNEINYRMAKANGQISEMPKTELQLRGIERKFKLNDAIYTFLLQKRSEAQIARASSLPDYDVVDPANVAVVHVLSPKPILNLLIALLLALILPTTVIVFKDFVNNRIINAEEAERLTSFPFIGRVFHNFHRSKQVVYSHPNSAVTESFRSVRTNFQFFSEGGKRQVILITSAASGEGKSFCSMNLATAFALNGNRTILLEFDLRRPKLHQEFGSSNIIGISTFLIDKANLEDIIVPTQVENLDLISAGPSAPNPAELIGSERTGELIDKLKEMYDYVIIDSAPAGILTETMLLMKHSDLNIFVVRLDKTFKIAFKNAIRSFETNKLTNVSILVNDLNIKKDAHKYGYDTKYYNEDNNSFIYKIFHKSGKAS
jgi:tyrosine-protein kinase Etk/Wzc